MDTRPRRFGDFGVGRRVDLLETVAGQGQAKMTLATLDVLALSVGAVATAALGRRLLREMQVLG